MTILQHAIVQLHELPKDYQERGQELLRELKDPVDAFDSFLAEAKVELEQKREDAHENAVRACRKQIKTIEELDVTIMRAQDRMRQADQETSAAHLVMRVTMESEPTRYPLKAEIEAWKISVQNAQKGIDEAEEKGRIANGTLGTMNARRADLVNHLRELEQEEYDLRPASEKGAVPPNNMGLMAPHAWIPTAGVA